MVGHGESEDRVSVVSGACNCSPEWPVVSEVDDAFVPARAAMQLEVLIGALEADACYRVARSHARCIELRDGRGDDVMAKLAVQSHPVGRAWLQQANAVQDNGRPPCDKPTAGLDGFDFVRHIKREREVGVRAHILLRVCRYAHRDELHNQGSGRIAPQRAATQEVVCC